MCFLGLVGLSINGFLFLQFYVLKSSVKNILDKLDYLENEIDDVHREMHNRFEALDAKLDREVVSLQLDIETAKNELVLLIQKKDVEAQNERTKNTKTQFKNLRTAFGHTSVATDEDN
jgi:hypothetical protein